jgi:hypothetical protein
MGGWFTWRANSGTHAAMCISQANTGSSLTLGTRGGGTITLQNTGGATVVDSGVSPTLNKWMFVMAGGDGTNAWILVDGTYVSTSIASLSGFTDPLLMAVGRYSDGAPASQRWFDARDGYSNDIFFFDRNFTEKEARERRMLSLAGYVNELNRCGSFAKWSAVITAVAFPYSLLGEDAQAAQTQTEILEAWRAKRDHPDGNGDPSRPRDPRQTAANYQPRQTRSDPNSRGGCAGVRDARQTAGS